MAHEPDAAGDEALYKLSGKGDTAAFERIVIRYQKALYGYFLRRTHQTGVAEELTQEVFLRLWRHAPLYQVRSKFQTYLYRIAHNIFVDYVRRSSARVRETSLDTDEGSTIEMLTADAAQAPDEPLGDADIKNRLREALPQLPEREREILLLVLEEGLPYRDCAEILRVPEGTIKSRVHSAVARLRQILRTRRKKAD